jgi:hypothetical protein
VKVIDKAAWQIDNGLQSTIVVEHFKRLFLWLDSKDMLTEEGKELLKAGIDGSVSLHERLITSKAMDFLDMSYDSYMKSNTYGTDKDSSALGMLYERYQKQQQRNPK